MSEIRRLDKHLQEVEEELGLIARTGLIAPPPPSADESQPWTGGLHQERLALYTQIINDIQTRYEDPQFTSLFEAAYAQLDLYLDHYLGLLDPQKAALFDQADPGILLDIGKSAKLCRYPEARKYVITIPEEDLRATPPVWASMAHELGHFVYWNSEFKTADGTTEAANGKDLILFKNEIVGAQPEVQLEHLEKTVQSDDSLSALTQQQLLTTLLLGWSEEIFADTFGTAIAGEEFAEQAKATYLNGLSNLQEKRFQMDSVHPCPFLRPYISATALEKQGGKATLWRTLKIKLATNALLKEKFLASLNLPAGEDADISDEHLQVEITVGREEDVILIKHPIKIDDLKRALEKIIPLLAEKIRGSTPRQRETAIWSHIEKFDDPQPVFIYRVIEGIGYWIKTVLSK